MFRTRFILSLFILAAGLAPARDWNVIDAGARPDGATDCTAAFQKALDDAGAAGGGVVNVPAGRFAIRGNLAIPAGVTLQGTYRVPPFKRSHREVHFSGSELLAFAGRGAQTGPPFIRLAGDCAVLSGVIVNYSEWKQSDVPPVPYPPCVMAEGVEDVAIQDCLLLNPYEGIRLIRAPRHFVCRVFGYPSWRGLYVDECYDIGRIENIHFWPFGVHYRAEDPFCQWVNVNGVAFEFARTDWHYVLNTFCFGYGVGYKFSASKAGSANGNFVGIGSDSSRRSVLVEQAQAPGLLITNGEFVGRWGSQDSVGVEIAEGAQGKVSLANCAFWGPLDRCIWAHGAPASQLTASACNFVEWDNTGSGSPAIQLDRGAAIVQGCTFRGHAIHVRVAGEVRSALLSANQAPGGFNVRSEAGRRCQAFGNEEGIAEWTSATRAHYRIQIGRPGDEPYLTGWFGQEKTGDAPTSLSTMRWSTAQGQLDLPVNPGKPCQVRLIVQVPPQALAPDAGVYLGSRRLLAIDRPGRLDLRGQIPPQQGDRLRLAIRCQSWSPARLQPGNRDGRPLGLSLRLVELEAQGAPARVYDANGGEWLK